MPKDDLLAGRRPRQREGFTLRDLCNHFLTAKKRQLDGGAITPRTFHDYHRVCERVVRTLDGNRLVEDLDPDDFGRLRDKLLFAHRFEVSPQLADPVINSPESIGK